MKSRTTYEAMHGPPTFGGETSRGACSATGCDAVAAPACHSRHGLTLVELLVVIAIIGVLVGLLLPAVQSARESGRRAVCGNNIKQLGLGLLLHHESARQFPRGTRPGDVQNWRVDVLPFIEQSVIASRLETGSDGDISVASPANSVVLDVARVAVFQCPSSRFGMVGSSGAQVMDYVGVAGAYPDPAGRRHVSVRRHGATHWRIATTGLMGVDMGARLDHCVDGASLMLLLAEQSGQMEGVDTYSSNTLGNGWRGAANINRNHWRMVLAALADTTGQNSEVSIRDVLRAAGVTVGDGGPTWYFGGLTTVRYRPNEFWLSNSVPATHGSPAANTVLNSFHPGGIHIVLADGAVRFFNESIDMDVFRRLSVRDDGQLIDWSW